MAAIPQIRRLDPSVVNKIAAGEIIISPVNALKELLENSIDAKATNIDVLVKDGGIKLLQIADNGCGINKSDLPILCERFTTSKLETFDDLQKLNTYGFRGEALASISHIARLTIVTKTETEKCAWKVAYSQGKMLNEPSPVAGKTGTSILIEDLFYNIPSRLRSLKSPSEEYNKILDVIGRYAIHSQNIGFSLKKFGDSQFHLMLRSNLTITERIRTVYSNSVASNLIFLELDPVENLNFTKIEGYVSDLNYYVSNKKSIQPIFFINERLVTCEPLKRALFHVYSNYMPKSSSSSKPFLYFNILIDPKTIDVNIHPTKKEVRFLNQTEIIEKISMFLHEKLATIDTSKLFKTSTLTTGTGQLATSQKVKSQQNYSNSIKNSIKVYEHNLVRTDASQSKITSFLQSSSYSDADNNKPEQSTDTHVDNLLNSEEHLDVQSIKKKNVFEDDEYIEDNTDTIKRQRIDAEEEREPKKVNSVTRESIVDLSHSTEVPEATIASSLPQRGTNGGLKRNRYSIIKKERVNVNLTSIKTLKQMVDKSVHHDLTQIFSDLIFVGVVDEEKRLMSVQHDLKLFLVDYGSICNELFYQIGLTDFANFGKIIVQSSSKDLTLINLLSVFDLDIEKKLQMISKLWEMREMLSEYFSIDLSTEGDDNNLESVQLVSIPLLLKNYDPPLSKLPFLIYRIGSKVDWDNEEACLDGILRQIALFNIPEIIEKIDTTDDHIHEDVKVNFVNKSKKLSYDIEHVIVPCIKRRFLAPRHMLNEVIEIANLPGLYKVFERC
ncbi:hypothetical protein KAFR_0B04840 [Kazachstania africana CBS 2517]|uniref:DNA mismatch repair protein S5 domain-containing protein n=1 Tax=Kazachstania africana (strain ATCC 22294 / BCRC 22015 / CBS 2517 / CECT 1963 / NBRC 1671 / NRRL Y-8276) TaxID=1071382 RepID=H2AQY0_KAZAF|nr:hypothetical protein KAFR_0B04840 [Kazachstania africana CBS 2517]CCF56780.1 hypothetical protein KAFR_0B04840 [Kazachstania africana CBS 2517]